MTPEEERREWPGLVGAFLMNFGAAEMSLLQWIDRLSKDKIVRDIAIDLPLNKRLALVCDLIKRSDLSKERKDKALSLWGEVSKISITRNIIAHNPFVTHENQMGFIDFKKLKGLKDGEKLPINPLTLVDVAKAGSRLSKVLKELIESFGWNQNKS